MTRKRYVIVGTGSRAYAMFAKPIQERFQDIAELTGLCDVNLKRTEYFKKQAGLTANIYGNFDEMLEKEKPDVVIVTTIDRYHHEYIIRALQHGCEVISEKPMTIDADKCNQILEAEQKSGKKVHIVFNCRFMPYVKRVKELLSEGVIGDIINVDFEYLLDTKHGADYFRRWHRRKENSGGLLVHKATHHFDMVNWWIDQKPVRVYANGTRRFYGPTRKERGERCLTCKYQASCEYAFDQTNDSHMQGLYFQAEDVDGYKRDACIFSDEIDIEDTMSVAVSYDKGALLTYSLVAYSPYEGWKIAFTGTKGRLEASTYMTGEYADLPENIIKLFNRKGETITFKVPKTSGAHGGGDVRLLEMLLRGNMPDPLGQLAGTADGVRSIMIGACANLSIKEQKPFLIDDLIRYPYDDDK